MAGQTHKAELEKELFRALTRLFASCETISTVADLARKAGYTRGPIDRVMKGRQIPDPKMLASIVRQLTDGDENKVQELKELRTRIFVDTEPASTSSATEPLQRGEEQLRVRYYDDTTSFYTALHKRLETASNEICVTYIREDPPTRYANDAAREYFADLMTWSTVNGRSVLRVIGLPITDGQPDGDFTRWLSEHLEETRSIFGYGARVVPWSVTSDNVNMALIDGVTTFITFSGMSTQQISGLSADSQEFYQRWRGFFDQLWGGGRELRRSIPWRG